MSLPAVKPVEKPHRSIDDLHLGEHIVFFYENDDEQVESIIPFIRSGLGRGEKVQYVSEPDGMERIRRALGNVEYYLESGALVFSSPEPDPEMALKKLGSAEKKAQREGFKALRLAIDAHSVYADMPPQDILIAEERLDSFYKDCRCIALCQFDTRRFTPELLVSVFISHPAVLIGSEIHENISYPLPRELLESRRGEILPKYLSKIMADRKALEDSLEKERDLWRKYLDIAGVIIVVIGPDERIQLMNRRGCELTGYNGTEVLGRNWFDMFIRDRDREHLRAAFHNMLEGKPEVLERHENIILTKSGRELIISWHNSVLRDERGEITGTLSSGEDITQRRIAEEHYRNLFENAEEGIFQITLQGRPLHINPAYARILGYRSPEDFMSNVASIEQHYVAPRRRKAIISALEKKGSIRGIEVQMVRRDGRKIWVSASIRLVDNAGGKYLEGMIEDITARKQAEAELRNTMKRLRSAMEGAIHAVAMTVEAKDPYTAGHQNHVAQLSREIAREMGLSRKEIEGIYLAGMIHDLGKISVPTEFLAKPGKLTDFEYSLIKTHAEAGYRILKDIDFPWPVAEIIRQHHERLDGSGYPRRLKADEILKETKIISCADVIEAMTFHRPYRPGFGLKLALEELKRNREKLYSGEVVDTCLMIFEKGEFVWDEVLQSS